MRLNKKRKVIKNPVKILKLSLLMTIRLLKKKVMIMKRMKKKARRKAVNKIKNLKMKK